MQGIWFQEQPFWEISNLVASTDPSVLSAMVGTSISANFTINQTLESEKTPAQNLYDKIEKCDVLPVKTMRGLRRAIESYWIERFMNNSMTETLQLSTLFTKEEHIKMAQICFDHKPWSVQ